MTTPADICRRARFVLHRRRAGKMACLPSAVRQQINVTLRDGLPYASIIAKLGDTAKTLNKDNEAKSTQIQPGFHSMQPDIAGLGLFADKVTHRGRFRPAGFDNPHLTASNFAQLRKEFFAGSEDFANQSLKQRLTTRS